jgi:phosphatidylserine/phosphatidylglycerophosphate/cardiolipin synthase-like enzyme
MAPRPAVVRVALAALTALVASLLALPASAQAQPSRAPAAVATTSTVGAPSRSYSFPPGSYFSYPNRRAIDRVAIRNRVLYTIQSVWGGTRTSLGTPRIGNGTIRIATWSFDDMTVARALVAARNRGVSVQVVAAATANTDSKPWRYLRSHLGATLYKRGHPDTRDTYSFARQCRGSCRGTGGTPHAKYFLFDNIGVHHVRHLVVSTSMNLTRFATTGQWNQAQVVRDPNVYRHFLNVFQQTRLGVARTSAFYSARTGRVTDQFFPYRATSTTDPAMRLLNRVSCTGALAGGFHGRTKVRVLQYAIYDTRGLWLARKLRYLWNRGCDVAIIYSLMTRPVLQILRSRSGRGPIPMRQSIVRNGAGEIVKYNHSKWMTISGHWGGSHSAYVTFSGSANWANLALSSDEQMQTIMGIRYARDYLATFSRTWKQRSSHSPGTTSGGAAGRTMAREVNEAVPGTAPPFGQGEYKYMTED